MPKDNIPHISLTTPDIIKDRLELLRLEIPEAFSEEKIDFEKLKMVLGEIVDDQPERYNFTWAGKKDAIRILQTPSHATLIPAKEESVDFETTQNIFIEGDNLEVLKLLYKPYFGRVKMIYIDPPYNTGNDFIYPDYFADPLDSYLKLTGQKDSEGNLLTSNPESSGRYHSAWLTMLYPRLFLARQLLREDGFIVVSIDDVEIGNLRAIFNELFGEENFIATLVWDRNRKNDAKFFSVGHEYMMVVAKNKQFLNDNHILLRAPKEGIDDLHQEYDRLRVLNGNDHEKVAKGLKDWFSAMDDDDPRKPLSRFSKVDERGPYRDDWNMNWPGGGGPMYDIIHPITGKPCRKPKNGWRFSSKDKMLEEIAKGNIIFGPDETTIPTAKWYLFEKADQVMRSVHYSYAQTATQEFDKIFNDIRVFENPKHYGDLSRMIEYLTDDDDVILDFFAGSCSTAHAVLFSNRLRKSNRKFICIQLPEPVNPKTFTGQNALKLGLNTIAEIGKERIRRVIVQMKNDRKGQFNFNETEDLGFKVFKLSSSNFKQWIGNGTNNPQIYTGQIELLSDTLLEGWKEENVTYEVAIKEGFGLNIGIGKSQTPEVFLVNDVDMGQSFYISLARKIHLLDLRPLNLKADDLFICRDIALDDEAAANLALQCRLKTI